MKEKLKEFRYWLEDKLKDFCGELTPDKRITVILIMLLILTVGNVYFMFSTIYNWGEDSGKQQLDIEHIDRLELERNRDKNYDFMDSVIDKQKAIQDSIDSIGINKQKFNEYERSIKNKYGPQTAA